MNQATTVANIELVDSLVQVILSLSHEERQLLWERLQPSSQLLSQEEPFTSVQKQQTSQTTAIPLINHQASQVEILQRIEQRRLFCPSQHNLPDTLTLLQDDRAR